MAEELDIGPAKNRKRVRPSGVNSSSSVATTAANPLVPTHEKATVSDEAWTAVPCPLDIKEEKSDIITKYDVLYSLSRVTKLKSSMGEYSEKIGTAMVRTQLGVLCDEDSS